MRGDNFSIKRTVTGVPGSRTIALAWLTVKSAISVNDATSLIFQKAITPSNVAGTGQIEDTGATGVGILRFDVTTANTTGMTADTQYYFDIQIKLDNNDILTLEKGLTSAGAQVTVATS